MVNRVKHCYRLILLKHLAMYQHESFLLNSMMIISTKRMRILWMNIGYISDGRLLNIDLNGETSLVADNQCWIVNHSTYENEFALLEYLFPNIINMKKVREFTVNFMFCLQLRTLVALLSITTNGEPRRISFWNTPVETSWIRVSTVIWIAGVVSAS